MPGTNLYYRPEQTLPDILKKAVEINPDFYIGYFDKHENLTVQTYRDLLHQARSIASGLMKLGLKKGDKLIIATSTNKETIELLWGGFFLGLVPTILQPPTTFTGYNPTVVKLMNVYHQLGEPYIFLSEGLNETGDFPAEKIKYPANLDYSGEFEITDLKPEDIAFIQFSSGSTGDPRGIMLSHSNLMVNMESIRIGLGVTYPDYIGNWMPLFHDMGLIGYHLTAMYTLSYQYHIETIDFIVNPGLWISLLSKYHITISGCPNFGIAMLLRFLNRKKIPQGWDLSSMKAMLNGAEPISVRIMNEFIEKLSPYGFQPEAMMPVYGMAEATLAVSFCPIMTPSVIRAFDSDLLDRSGTAKICDPADPSSRLISEVGVALNDVEIRIVDDEDKPVPENIAGHIQIKGPAVTKGYFNNPQATEAAFCGEWLKTGDIGFFCEGRLFISGRHKDIIFKNGRNYFANDLESIALTMESLDYGKVCFGGTTDKTTGQDKVVVFVAGIPETRAQDTFFELRALLRSNIGISIDEMILIKSNEIPKTSSGKLQRYKLMQRYLNGDFENRVIRE